MASDSTAKAFVCLADIDWLTIVIEECVDAPLVTTDPLPVIGGSLKEGVNLFAYYGYFSWRTEGVGLCAGFWFDS